jgi:Fe2+ or Zn2+ uptake regulation protein
MNKSKGHQSHALLNKVGLKKTDSRIALLDLLSKNKEPLSVKDIVSKLYGDKVTIYRMLEAMNKKGLIRRVDTGEREAQYEIIDHHDDHHHVICLDCKKVSNFTGCDANNLIIKALKQVKNFKQITHHSFDLFGICNNCVKK